MWVTRYQSDGRCDYRKGEGNRPKRSLSLYLVGREVWKRTAQENALTDTAEGYWQTENQPMQGPALAKVLYWVSGHTLLASPINFEIS